MRQRKKSMDKEPIKDRKSVIEILKENIEIISLAIGACTVLYSILNYANEFTYKVKCEKYYNIPRKYFSTSINDTLLYLGIMIFLSLFVIITPFLIRRDDIKNKNDNKKSFRYAVLFSVLYGGLLGVINIINLITILDSFNTSTYIFKDIINWLNENTFMVSIIILSGAIITIFGITFVNDIKKMRKLQLQRILEGVISICVIINIVLMISGLYFKLSKSIEDKTKYEIITNQEEDLIIITEIDEENLLVANYNVSEDGKTYQINTSEYRILNKLNLQYAYIDFENPPVIINKSKE